MQKKDIIYYLMIAIVIITCCFVIYYLKHNAHQCLADPIEYYEKIKDATCYCMNNRLSFGN